MKKTSLLIVLFTLFVLRAPQAFADKELLVDRVVAIVNDEVITQSQFDVVFRPIYQQLIQTYQGDQLKKELQKTRIKFLSQLIEDKLVYSEAKALGIEASESEVRDEMGAFKKQFSDDKEFEKQLRMDGMTVTDIENRFRERIAIEKLHHFVIRKQVIVTPSEVEKYYQENAKEFIAPERIELWVITAPKDRGAVETGMMDEKAKSKAERLLQDLRSGADFETLASEYSEDSHAEKGGYIGIIGKGDLVKSIDDILFALSPNEISDVLETDIAYHIFKVGKKMEQDEKNFEEAKDQVREFLFRKKSHEKFVEWMDDLKERSYISIR